MDRLIYTALTGMDAAMARQRMNANNLANASTPGFRADVFATTVATIEGETLRVRAPSLGAVRSADLSAGRVVPTGRELDVAIEGDALLALQAPDGSEVYSRRGDLQIAASGVLENGSGLPVMGESGPITVPPGLHIGIAPDGTLTTRDPAAPDASPQVLARLKLVSPEGSAVVKGIDNLLRVPGGGVLPPDPTATLATGALEQSNVDGARVMVEMIEAQRGFEQRASVIQTAGRIDEAGTRLMSLGRQ